MSEKLVVSIFFYLFVFVFYRAQTDCELGRVDGAIREPLVSGDQLNVPDSGRVPKQVLDGELEKQCDRIFLCKCNVTWILGEMWPEGIFGSMTDILWSVTIYF